MIGGERNDKNNIDFSYYRVYGWMSSHLKLKGTEKEIFAIIYHYTTAENAKGYFNGSISYLQEWTNIKKRDTVISYLKNLMEKNLIIRIEDNSKHRQPNIYKANLDILPNTYSVTSPKNGHD